MNNKKKLLANFQQLFLSMTIWIFVFNLQVAICGILLTRDRQLSSVLTMSYVSEFSSTCTSRPFQLESTRSGKGTPKIYSSYVLTLTSIRF